MAYPRATIRPVRRRRQQSTLLQKLTLAALVLLAIVCFLPAGKMVKADAAEKENDYGTVIGIDLVSICVRNSDGSLRDGKASTAS